nr:uncharacterized protein LOC105870015 [Microcebus murinus]
MVRSFGALRAERAAPLPPSPRARPGAKLEKQRRPAAAGTGCGLQPAPGGGPRERRPAARRRDSCRGSREEEPEVAAGGSGPGEEPQSPEAEHAAPACSARVQPARRGGDRAEAVAPGRCLGPDRLHVSPARGHVHRLSPVRRPDVLRINKMKLGETGGQIAPGSPSPRPRPLDPPTPTGTHLQSRPAARPEPAGQVAAPARPRPPAPPRRPGGALPQSLIKKVAKLTLPKVVVACAPLGLPARYSLKHD